MRSDYQPSDQPSLTFIEAARRQQIIDHAIQAFAELGYAKTSLARIAQRAGISKGVISYHFAGKDELMNQVVDHVFARITDSVVPQVTEQTGATARLAARIRAVATFVRENPADLRALAEILDNLRNDDGSLRYGAAFNEPIYQGLESEFTAGQATGELRSFDTRVMAVTVQAGIDAMIDYWNTHPEHDLDAHAEELASLLIRAITADGSDAP